MKKILFLIAILLVSILSLTWLYFKNLSPESSGSGKILNLIPDDASIIFEYKNENSFYDIFSEFTLFKGVIGRNNFDRLNNLKEAFITNPEIAASLDKSNIFFSLNAVNSNQVDFLMVAALSPNFNKNNSSDELVKTLGYKYAIKSSIYNEKEVFKVALKNNVFFNFMISQSVLIGSFNDSLLKKTIVYMDKKEKVRNNFFDTETPRNKNAIANLFINFAQLPKLLMNFSGDKNSVNTSFVNDFKAYASLNINYQSDAFMFSGIAIPDTTNFQYANLFLHQKPGKLSLNNLLPIDVASYCTFYASNPIKFMQDLHQQYKLQNTYQKLKDQIHKISIKHSINLEKEFSKIFGNEFGVAQLASGDKIGLIKTVNAQRLSFLLSVISTEVQPNIRHFDDANVLNYFLGEPFKFFKRPYFTIVNNCFVIAETASALKNYMQKLEQQKLLSLSEKYINFQQYLSNQGNVFFFFHNKNSKAIIKRFLTNEVNQAFMSNDFQYQNIYGLSIQFSADKNKFYTNLYMNSLENKAKPELPSDSQKSYSIN